MEYKLKRGWSLKELAPLSQNPTCRVFKLKSNEPFQVTSNIDSQGLTIAFIRARSTLRLSQYQPLLVPDKSSSIDLGIINTVYYTGKDYIVITESHEISNNCTEKDNF